MNFLSFNLSLYSCDDVMVWFNVLFFVTSCVVGPVLTMGPERGVGGRGEGVDDFDVLSVIRPPPPCPGGGGGLGCQLAGLVADNAQCGAHQSFTSLSAPLLLLLLRSYCPLKGRKTKDYVLFQSVHLGEGWLDSCQTSVGQVAAGYCGQSWLSLVTHLIRKWSQWVQWLAGVGSGRQCCASH